MLERIETARLILRKPRLQDAEAVFARYASDEAVTRMVAFPRHRSVNDSMGFLQFSDTEWAQRRAGPYLVESRKTGLLLGSTGISLESPQRANTGYVFAKDAWGNGYATECVQAIVEIAKTAGVIRLYALSHPDNQASCRVLEKCEFEREGVLRKYCLFPNLGPAEPQDVVCYARILG